MEEVIVELERKVASLRADLEKAEQALALVQEVLGVEGMRAQASRKSANASPRVAPATSQGNSLASKRKGGGHGASRESARAIREKHGMSMTEFIACTIAEYPGISWTAAELWDVLSEDFTKMSQMFNGCLAARTKGLVVSPEKGVYASTKSGEKLRAAKIKSGILKTDGSKRKAEPASSKKKVDSDDGELTGLGRALLGFSEERPGRSPGSPAKRPDRPPGKAKSPPSADKGSPKRGPTSDKASSKRARISGLEEIVGSLTRPKIDDEQNGMKRMAIETVDLSDVCKNLRGLLAARPDEIWRFSALVRESGIDSKLIAAALHELVRYGEIQRTENGSYLYAPAATKKVPVPALQGSQSQSA